MRLVLRLVSVVAVLTVLTGVSQFASAQATDYPAKGKVITLIVPYGVGGGADITARAVQPWLEKELGVPIVIINKPGGGGQVGLTEFFKTAKTDGYTVAMTLLPAVPSMYLDPRRKATFTRKDFKLIANIALDAVSIVVKPDSPFKTLKDMIEAAKANPRKIKVTSAGLMTTSHVAAVQLELATGVKFAHMFFEQQGEQRAALLGGHVDVEFNPISETASAITSRELKALAICDDKPSRFEPSVPTAISLGYKCSMSSARGIAVPTGTPEEIVGVLDGAVKRVLANPDNQQKLDKMMLGTRYLGPKEYDAYFTELEKTVQAVLDATK